MAGASRLSLAWSNINKSLPLRAIVFDARCILRSSDEAAAPGAPKRQEVDLGLRRPESLIAEGKVQGIIDKIEYVAGEVVAAREATISSPTSNTPMQKYKTINANSCCRKNRNTNGNAMDGQCKI